MAYCDRCGNFDESHREEMEYPKDGQHCIQDYQPEMYYYWHGDIQEDYQMPAGYECLCERCFGDLLCAGEIIEKYDDLTGEPNPKWNPDEMGWFIPYVEETHGT